MPSLRKYFREHFEPVRWRDETIARQQKKLSQRQRRIRILDGRLRQLEDELDELRKHAQNRLEDDRLARIQAEASDREPSFRREMLSLRTQVHHTRAEDPKSRTALRQIPNKLRNYSIAMSHGIRTPQIHALWADLDSIDFSGLPDSFVLKSDGGAGGRGVFPLHRMSDNAFRIAGHTRDLTVTDIKDAIRAAAPGMVRPPFFAEEFVQSRGQVGPIPHDVKIYAFYGEIGQILLRSVAAHGSHDSVRYRYIWPDGSDLGTVSFDRARAIDPSVPIPSDLSDMLEVARHLSLCIGTPFVRVDVYDTANGATLGELTRAPGGEHNYRKAHDRQMGAMWLRARMQYEHDLMSGRPPGALYGDRPTRDFYRELGSTTSGPGAWPRESRPCADWCQRHVPVTPPAI